MDIFNDDSNFIFLLNAMGQKIKINDKEVQALISNLKDMTIDYKKLKTIVPFQTGDLIQYQNSNWLVVSEVSHANTIYKATMRKCQYNLKFSNKRAKIFETPCILNVSTQALSEGKFFMSGEGNIELYIKDTSLHRQMDEGKRFIVMGYAWSITGISMELPGLIHLYCKKGTFMAEDNRGEELAYNNEDISVPPVVEKPIIPTEPTDPIPPAPVPPTPVYTLQGSDTLDTKTIQTYTIVDNNNIPVVNLEFSWKFEKVGSVSPTMLFVFKGSTVNSYSLLAKSAYTKGSFILVATCKTDANIIIKKEIKVI